MSATRTGTDVVPQMYSQLPDTVHERWSIEDVRTMLATVFQGLNVSEAKMVLSIAAKYDLDPLLREIWGAKGKPKDGNPGKLLIMVGRDGLLRNARRQPEWKGFDSDVVCENDEFEVRRSSAGREIIHNYKGDVSDRGKIKGAWCQVYQAGAHETYVYCPAQDYMPTNPHKSSSWATNPYVMMEKCAISLAHRLAFNMSGVLGEEEAGRIFDEAPPETGPDVVLDRVPEDLRDRFAEAWEQAQRLFPGKFTTAVVGMSIGQQDHEFIERYLQQMEADVRAASRQDEEQVTDAEVVQEGPEPVQATEHSQDEVERTARAVELREEWASLRDRRREVEENPGDQAETEAELDSIGADLDRVEGELRELGIDPNAMEGQESLL